SVYFFESRLFTGLRQFGGRKIRPVTLGLRPHGFRAGWLNCFSEFPLRCVHAESPPSRPAAARGPPTSTEHPSTISPSNEGNSELNTNGRIFLIMAKAAAIAVRAQNHLTDRPFRVMLAWPRLAVRWRARFFSATGGRTRRG